MTVEAIWVFPLSDLMFYDEVFVAQIPFVILSRKACTLHPGAGAGITDFQQFILAYPGNPQAHKGREVSCPFQLALFST